MPVVYREGPFVFRIWPADHDPPHVHVYNGDGTCVIEIETGKVRDIRGMRLPDVNAAGAIAGRNWVRLLAAWRKIHGV
ncbi:MAG: DUF4160 domain-containing protein [Gemmatimonadetes bacterium]|nr:DUF4160 domain-containing protein [Gemmatimonadota bacterium]